MDLMGGIVPHHLASVDAARRLIESQARICQAASVNDVGPVVNADDAGRAFAVVVATRTAT